MRKLKSFEGKRLKSGVHTSYVVIENKGKYYISQESGTRPATKREIKQIKQGLQVKPLNRSQK